jgi:hypothetical protein
MRKIELKRPQSGGSRERGLTSRHSPAVTGADTRLGRRCRYGTSIQLLAERLDEAKRHRAKSAKCPLYPQKRTLVERRRSLRWPPITILLLLRRRFPILAQRQTRNLVISDHRACARAHAPRTVVRSEGSLASALSSSSAFSSNSAACGQPIAANVRIRSDK